VEGFNNVPSSPGLAVDQGTEAFFEGELAEGGLLELFFEAFCHSSKFHRIEFIDSLFSRHDGSPFIGNNLFL